MYQLMQGTDSGVRFGSGDAPDWRRAERSYATGNCVDVSGAYPLAVGHCGVWVADSYLPYGWRLYVMRDHWTEFIDRVKNDCAVLEPVS